MNDTGYANDKGYELISSIGYADYSWDAAELYTKEGKVYWRTGGGCSCNDISDFEIIPLTDENWNEFQEEVKRLGDPSDADKTEFLALSAKTLREMSNGQEK